MDFSGADGGGLAGAFAAGCVATWGFVQMVMIGPIKKTLYEHKADCERQYTELKNDCEHRERRLERAVDRLQDMLLIHGSGPLRNDLQKALSEQHLEMDAFRKENS